MQTVDRKVKVSIIVPVYNIEKYLVKNIQSLLKIKRDDVEFIYVNDGSTDNSEKILDRFRQKDTRIKIVSQNNSGLSAARNTGVAEASGEWILFVDGDDWVDSEQTEKLLSEANDQNDMVWGKYEIVDAQGNAEAIMDESGLSVGDEKDGIMWMQEGGIAYTACVYLYKTELLRENKVLFPVGFLHEDMEFVPEIFYYAKKVKYTGILFYKYVNRPGSISRTKNVKRSRDLIQIAGHLEHFENENVVESQVRNYFQRYRGELCAEALHIAILDRNKIRDIFNDNSELKEDITRYLKESSRKRDQIAGMMISWNLYWLYEWMYRQYDKLRERREEYL